MKVTNQLDQALEDGLRARHALPDVLRTMRDAMEGQPAAQSYDTLRGGKRILWCWEHEHELKVCHKRGHDCLGESIPVDDQTGEAAISADQARADQRETIRDVAALALITDRLISRFSRYQAKAATEKQRRETEQANDPGCELCHRVGQFSPPRVLSSDAKGNLDRPHRLCIWHYEFVLATGRKPTDDEERAHIAGKPVRLRAS